MTATGKNRIMFLAISIPRTETSRDHVQRPFSSSYSMISVWPGTRCSAAAVRAAKRASAWVGNGSENTPLTVYAQPSSCRTN